MRKSISKYLLVLVSISLIFSTGCDSERTEEINPAFVGFISGFTSGIVSNETTIRINLTETGKNVQYEEPIDDDLFDFSPNIDGEAYWVDDNTIEFRPEERLTSGTHFKAEFYLSEIVDVPSDLETFYFDFETIKQGLNVEFAGVRAYDNNSLEWQQVTFQLTTSDYTDIDALEEVISAKQNSKELNITWDHSLGNKLHSFTVDSVKRGDERGELFVSWNGEAILSEENGEKNVEIPSLTEFKVIDIKVEQQPEQAAVIYFSDPVNNKQDLEGLIYLNNAENLRFDIDENSVTAYPSRRLSGTSTITVDKSLKNSINYNLMEAFTKEITFTNLKPKVELIGEGVIMPNSDGLVFPFKAVNISAVKVKVIKIYEKNIAQFFQVNHFDGTREMKRVGRIVHRSEVKLTSTKPIDYGSWNTYSLDLSTLINAEPGAIYRVELSFDKKHSLFPCENNEEEDEFEIKNNDKEEARYDQPNNNYYYDDYYYDYDDDYSWRERENPCSKSYYLRNSTTVAKNLFVSNLGIIAKGGDGNVLTAAITDISTTNPISGVEVEIYNYQNKLMKKAKTDGDGLVDIELDKKPFLLVAKHNGQTGYLRLDDGSSLSMSMFDVGGAKNKKGLKGFLYGERGVWRPGDSLYLSFILEDKNRVLPINHPVVMELYTPDNQLFSRKVKTIGENGFYDFRTKTDDDSPTGNWIAKVKVGGSSFSKTIKIEAIKPNRLKIKLDFDGDVIKDNENNIGSLDVKWLHGAIAGNIKTDVELTLTSSKTKFEDYPEYSFDDPSKRFNSEEKMIFNSKLNSEGQATVYPKINVGRGVAPGVLNANFKIRAFENGGNFSIDRFTMPYSTYRGYVGVKVPEGEGWNGAIYANEPNLIPIVTVDEDGKPVDRKNLKIEIFDVYWRWWWERSDRDDLSRYVANRSKNLIKEDVISTKNGKAIYELKFDRNYWGRKLIRITDPTTGHSAGQTFYLTYKGWWNSNSGDNPGGAEMLTFSCDKKTYSVDEEVKVNLPPASKGRALVSIESGSKVIERKWVEISEENNTFSFKTTPEMAPNAYVNVSLIQPHNQVDNDLPIRLYGVQMIHVEDEETHLHPQIKMPKELAPESEVTIKVDEKNGKKMTYTIAIVDDGLLDLTRFKTPNPWSVFYAREALGIKTWDMYKYVMNAFTGEMAGLLALGGDDNINPNSGPKANRFKPVVLFKGPFTIEKGSSKTHKFKLPNYVGSVRTMVVAGNDGAYGFDEKTTPVKKPLMVLATLPRTLSPNERVKLPVTVFAMDKKVKNVTVQVKSNKLLKVNGSSTKNITFSREGDKVVEFDLDVAEAIGIGKVQIVAKSGKEVATYDFELNIKPANPKVSEVTSAAVEAKDSWSTTFEPVGMKGTNKAVVEVSKIPSINLEKRLGYLVHYPHGCIEQTTSGVFPQLFLKNLLELDNQKKEEIETNIRAGINRLKKFQVTNGGLSYWPGNSDADEWGTTYAGHFMIEAQNKGYSLPSGFLNKWIKFQKKMANSWSPKSSRKRYYSYRNHELIQAYRLYTLALAKKPALGAMNRMKEIKELSVSAKWRLAAAYVLAGKNKVAANMVKNIATSVEDYRELSYSYGSSQRDQAMILETLTAMKEKTKAQGVLKDITKQLGSENWYSTQTTAYSLMAIAKFIGTTGEKSDLMYDVYYNGKKIKNISTKASIALTPLKLKGLSTGEVKVVNKTGQTLFIKLNSEGIPLEGDKTSSSDNMMMSVKYYSMDEKEINVNRLEQGTDFYAEVTVTHPGIRNHYQEMALTQIFPSGWEIRNTRMDIVETKKIADKPEYMDVRDDRVYSYFDINKHKTNRFRIILNASYLGKFYLPTVYCEAMYDNEINARTGGKWIEVVKGGE